MSFPSGSFFASVYQASIPNTDLKITNFPLPSQSFFIGIPYIIVFVIANTPGNAADALYLYNRSLYDDINQVPGAIALLRTYTFIKGCSQKIGLWGTDGGEDIYFKKTDNTYPYSDPPPPETNVKPITKAVMMYTNHGYFQYGTQINYFSTLDNGTTLYYRFPGVPGVPGVPAVPATPDVYVPGTDAVIVGGVTIFPAIPGYTIPGIPGTPAVDAIPGIPEVPSTNQYPDSNHTYNVYRYFTSLKYGDVNLNTNPSFVLGWSSSDISGDYGADVALLSMYHENGTKLGPSLPVTYNKTIDSTTTIPDPSNPSSTIKLLSTIPSGKYYYIYDFVSITLQALTSKGIEIYYATPPKASDNDSLQKTPVFTFITQFPQSISSTNTIPRDTIVSGTTIPGGTTIITGDIGIGYPLYTYLLSVNDTDNFSTRVGTDAFPYAYKPPPTLNTRTYTVTLSDSSDTYNTGSLTTTFIAYQYVANLAIATRIIQSPKNFLTWTGGSAQEQFKYGSTIITTNGLSTFNSGNKVDATGFTGGTGYQFIPTNLFETNPAPGAYPTIYFDSIVPNQRIFIAGSQSLQRYTLAWAAYYKFSTPAPDGPRQYEVTLTGNGTTYTGTSNYNVLTVPFSAVTNGIPYKIQVEGITLATDIYFFDAPTNFTITPGYINFTNTITWSSVGNPVFNVKMEQYEFQSSSPYTYNFTESIIDLIGDVSFWPLGATESSSIVTNSYALSANTISVSLPTSILVFSGATISFDVGSYLYPVDTYSLSLYRNGVVQQLEATITNPFTWIPYKYLVTYQPGDQLYIKSNQHLNYGLSVPFTLVVNTPINIQIVPNKINFTNTISWSLENNPVLNVKMGNYTFQSSSPYTQNFTENIIQPTGTISFWPIGADPSNAVVAGNYNLSANTIYVILPASFPVFSGVFFSFDIGAVLYRNDRYSLSLYRNGVVKQLEASITTPFTWFPYKYLVTYQPGDQIYVKSNQRLNYGLSVPFTLQVNASVVVDKLMYNLFSAVVATMTIDVDVAFTARLRGPTIIPVTFTQEGNQYTIQLKDYSIPLGNYRLEFLLVNSPTILVPSQTFLVTTDITLDQVEYTLISTVNASVYVSVPTTFSVVLQDIDHLFPPIPLPSFTANLLTAYSFKLYGLPVQDANYVLQFTSNIVLTSPVVFISRSYFSFDELILPTPPSRATTNTLCTTSKKNNIPTIIISIKNNIVYPTAIRGQRQYLVPCGVLPYLKELTELLKTMTLRNALLFLIQKYNIPQNTPPVTNQKRYQLPTANFKVLNPIVQYTASFRLAGSTPGVSVGYDIRFVDKLTDARFVTLCNDDTKTFSSLYTDMLKNATYWISTLARFTKDGDFTYCVVRPVNGSLKQILTGSITLVNNRLIFTPYILRLVLAFYQPYGAIDMTIMYSSKSLEDIYNYLYAAYVKIYLNPATAL